MWKLYAPIIVLLVVITYSPSIGYAPNPDRRRQIPLPLRSSGGKALLKTSSPQK